MTCLGLNLQNFKTFASPVNFLDFVSISVNSVGLLQYDLWSTVIIVEQGIITDVLSSLCLRPSLRAVRNE